MKSVGAYEAKTHLPRLLDEVAAGESVLITKHGVSVAKLVPVKSQGAAPQAAIDALRAARAGVTLGGVCLRALIEEGRQ